MAGQYAFKEFSPRQRQIYEQAVGAYEAYRETLRQIHPFRGGMHWKKIRGREYLYRYRNRSGDGRSLGPRSSRTEEIYRAFARERQDLAARRDSQHRLLTEQARFCRAALIQRVPRAAAQILRLLSQQAWGQNLIVLGGNALAAYEFAAGVFIDWDRAAESGTDAQSNLMLAADREVPRDELLALLRRADHSFAPLAGDDFGAMNKKGYRVKVWKPSLKRSGRQEITRPGLQGPGPAATRDLSYLSASPRFSQVVIGKDGSPVTMVVPDPRAFALHQLWLSQQDDRDEAHRSRDRAQALAVADLILSYLPQYHFFSAELRLFSRQEGRQAGTASEGLEFPGDQDIEY